MSSQSSRHRRHRYAADDSIRLFVALYPPADVTLRLLETLAGMDVDLDQYRLIPREQIHMTIHFIGPTDLRKVDEVLESVQRARKGLSGFRLRIKSLMTLPESGPPPRLIAAETDCPGPLRELQIRLARRFARPPRSQPGNRFRPHLTLCRFKPGCTEMGRFISNLADGPSFEVGSIRLMKSTLHPKGARHEVVAECPMPLPA